MEQPANHRPIVTVVGSFAVGMTIRTQRMPIFGETIVGSDFDMGPGGKGSNQAIGAARLGANAFFCGIIGEDKLGEIATEIYALEGVDTTYLQRTTARATGVGMIIVNQSGHNGIILDMAANELIDAKFVDGVEAQIARSDIVMTVLEIPVVAAARAMEVGRKKGVRTILNPAPAAWLDDAVLQNVDYLTPNETELRILMGLPPDAPESTQSLARSLHARGAANLIVTLGAEGALIVNGDGVEHVPGLAVDVVDTTGAGDAFNAGLAIALAEGKSLLQAVRFANCAGAIGCTRLGVIPALGSRSAVDALHARNYG